MDQQVQPAPALALALALTAILICSILDWWIGLLVLHCCVRYCHFNEGLAFVRIPFWRHLETYMLPRFIPSVGTRMAAKPPVCRDDSAWFNTFGPMQRRVWCGRRRVGLGIAHTYTMSLIAHLIGLQARTLGLKTRVAWMGWCRYAQHLCLRATFANDMGFTRLFFIMDSDVFCTRIRMRCFPPGFEAVNTVVYTLHGAVWSNVVRLLFFLVVRRTGVRPSTIPSHPDVWCVRSSPLHTHSRVCDTWTPVHTCSHLFTHTGGVVSLVQTFTGV